MNELEAFARARFNIKGIQYLPIKYQMEDYSELAVIKGDKDYRGDIILPDTIDGIGGTYKVVAISPHAFENCEELSSIKLPKGLQFIGESAFRNCSHLKSVIFNEDIKTIDSEAFKGCSQLSEVVIPNENAGGIEKMGQGVFRDTQFWHNLPDGLVYFYHALVGLKGKRLRKIQIKEGTTAIADLALYEVKQIKELNFPNSLKTIGVMSCNRNHIKHLIIPEGVEEIGYYAFDRCHELESISLPSTLKTVNVASFFDSRYLTSITVNSTVPPEVIDNIGIEGISTGEKLYASPYTKRQLYVPVGTKSSYVEAPYWKKFKTITEIQESTTDDK